MHCGEDGWLYDGGFFGESGQGEEGGYRDVLVLLRTRSRSFPFGKLRVRMTICKGGCSGEVEGEGGEGEGGGEDVGVGQGALGEPDGVDGREEGDGYGSRRAEEALGEAEDGQECSGSEGAGGEARCEDAVAGKVPEGAEDDVGKRRVRVGELGDEGEAVVEVERGGDVVTAFVPEVGETEEGEVREGDCGEEEREEQEGWERGEVVGCAGSLLRIERNAAILRFAQGEDPLGRVVLGFVGLLELPACGMEGIPHGLKPNLLRVYETQG